MGTERYKLAMVTPWIPQKTGIAVYEANLLPYLAQYFSIDIYTSVDCDGFKGADAFYPMEQIRDQSAQYDLVVYEMGNNAKFHKDVFELLEECSTNSLIELHDLVLGPFFLYSYGSASEKFGSVIRRIYGDQAEEIIPLFIEHGNADKMRINYPLGDRVARYTKYVIVHNQWCKTKIGDNCFFIPLAAFGPVIGRERLKERIRALEYQYNLRGELVIGCFGSVGRQRRVPAILTAVRNLLDQNYKFKFVFWGEVKENTPTARQIAEAGLEATLKVTGYLDKEDYWAAMWRTDIAVNLRYPSSGEASGTLVDQFSVGKPVIISNHAAYCEYPDDICIKIASGEDEAREREELEQALIRLIDSEELREQLGAEARKYLERERDPQKVAEMYYKVISGIIEE